MGCIVTITDKLNIKNSANKDFSSEESFDSWLSTNKVAIKRALAKALDNPNIDISSPTFAIDLDPIEQKKIEWDSFMTKMQTLHASANDHTGIMSMDGAKALVTLGTTTAFKYIGNVDDVTLPVNDFKDEVQQKIDFIQDQIVRYKISTDEAEKRWNVVDRNRKLTRIDGTIMGAIVQDLLTNSTKDIDNLRKRSDFLKDLKSVNLDFDSALQRVINKGNAIAQNIKRRLISTHGSNIKIFTEVEIISKQLSTEFAQAVSTASMKTKNKSANAINGFIDIIVQDSSGNLHSYDIKLSSHKINDWWSQYNGNDNWKYREVSAQQMAYYTMAKQWGINFSTVNVIPIFEELNDDGDIVSLQDEEFRTFGFTNPYAIACANYFPVHTETNSKSVDRLSKLINELYPGIQLDIAAQTRKITKGFIIDNKLDEVDGKWQLVPDIIMPEWKQLVNKHGVIVFNSHEDAEKFVETEYVPQMNMEYSKELLGFASDLRRLSSQKRGVSQSLEDLKETARGLTKDKHAQEFIINKFKKFVVGGWDLISDEENRLAEYGIFIFTKNNLAEVILIDKTDLMALVELGNSKNTTILGNIRHDLANGMDDLNILKSYRGNLMMMKAMAFISQNPNLFEKFKIQAVKAINIRWGQELSEANNKLIDNWNTLAGLYNIINKGISGKTVLRTLGPEFLSTPLAYVQRANDIAETFLESNIHFKAHENNLEHLTDDSAEEILTYIRNLTAGSKIDITSTPSWGAYSDELEAYNLLMRAYMAVRGWIVSAEQDTGSIFSHGIFIAGTESLSPAESTSSTIRVFNQIETTYEQKLRDIYRQYTLPWQNLMAEVYEEAGITNLFGNEREMFKNCFYQYTEGKNKGDITKDFCLIPPDSNPYLKKRPKLKKLVEMFLETINEYRIPNENERIRLSQIPKSIYYQVPLTETSFIHQALEGDLVGAISTKAQNVFSEMKNFAYGSPMSDFQIKQFNDVGKERVYDPYLDISEEAQRSRNQILSEQTLDTGKRYKVSSFETDLDTVFLKTMASALRARVSEEFMPLFTGLRLFLAYNSEHEGINTPQIQRSMNDFIKSTVFNKLIIEPGNQTIYHILRMLRGLTSNVTLAINLTAMAKEQIASALRTSVSLINDPFFKGKISESDYMEQVIDIIVNSPKNADVLSEYMQFNFVYGLANVSQEQMAEANKSKFLNPHNWQSDLLFWTTTSPDFVHRNAICRAFLKGRGSLKAYKIIDGKLVYNMQDDDFYSVFYKYKDNPDAITDRKTELKFIEQRKYYENALQDWNRRYGMNLQWGEDLPQALSPTEANGIRVYADHLYGNYDGNTKSLLQKQLLGSLFLQFKTFTLQQFLQNVRDKGYVNMTEQHHVTTIDGKKTYEWYPETPEEIAEYGVHVLIDQDELDEGIKSGKISIKNVRPFIIFTGCGVSGRLVTDLQMAISAITNRDQFLDNWKNSPVYRANLYISLIDNLGFLLIAMLLRLLYDEDVRKHPDEAAWWTRWSYTVLSGVAQEGPIHQITTALIGNGAPPSIAIIKSFVKNASDIITGEKSAIYGFMNSFGATRSFAGMFT